MRKATLAPAFASSFCRSGRERAESAARAARKKRPGAGLDRAESEPGGVSARILSCEAIVLRNLRFGDTSRVATLFTRELGKIGVIAKGARLPSSPFGATVPQERFFGTGIPRDSERP